MGSINMNAVGFIYKVITYTAAVFYYTVLLYMCKVFVRLYARID